MSGGYAIRLDMKGWRSVSSEDSVLQNEWFSADPVELSFTFAQALAAINAAYIKDRDELCSAWLRAAVADGVEESSRKEDVEAELTELDAKHAKGVVDLKSEYGVA